MVSLPFEGGTAVGRVRVDEEEDDDDGGLNLLTPEHLPYKCWQPVPQYDLPFPLRMISQSERSQTI
jgi:hypothetical protein